MKSRNPLQSNDSDPLFASLGKLSRGGGHAIRTPPRNLGRSEASPSLVSVLGSSGRSRNGRNGRSQSNLQRALTPFDLSSSMNSPRRIHLPPTPLSTRTAQDVANAANSPRRKKKQVPVASGVKSVSISPARRPMSTPQKSIRLDSATPSRHVRSPLTSSSSDRFIPNRSMMRVDICKASILSAEKSRMNAIEKKMSEQKGGENGPASSESQSPINNNNASTPEILTPIQSEYRARLRGTLLNLGSDGMHIGTSTRSVPSSSSVGTDDERSSTTFGLHSVTPNLQARESDVDLVYASLSSVDENTPHGRENTDPNRRMLSFRSNLNETFFQPGSIACENQASNSTLKRRAKGNQGVITPNPYSHDQLHVFDRTNQSSMFVDPAFESALRSSSSKTTRKINAAPTRILDAPELVDDYYLNLISWGKDNILAVALGQCVYLWNAVSGEIQHLLTLPGEEDFVTSVRWAELPGHTNYLAVGTHDGPVELWDAVGVKRVRTLRGHAARVGSLSWNQHLLSSGGRDSIIIQHDVRNASHIISTYGGHTQEVCGLEWNEDGTTLASGGNENYLCIWDAAMSLRRNVNRRNSQNNNRDSPRLILTQHQAAVKALAWCPFHRGLLASGGGTADRTIKFWNSNSGALLNSIDTGSQVCSLLWSKHQRELCSSHGFSENQLILWRYPTMTKIQEFKGHTARVLHMEQSPDGASVVSAAADETLRFWDVFGSPPSKSQKDTFSMGGFSGRSSILR